MDLVFLQATCDLFPFLGLTLKPYNAIVVLETGHSALLCSGLIFFLHVNPYSVDGGSVLLNSNLIVLGGVVQWLIFVTFFALDDLRVFIYFFVADFPFFFLLFRFCYWIVITLSCFLFNTCCPLFILPLKNYSFLCQDY